MRKKIICQIRCTFLNFEVTNLVIQKLKYAQTHCNNIKTILCNLLWISSNSPKKLLKLGLKLLQWVWTGKLGLINIIYSTARFNQFENKDVCIEFVINNVSAQGNNNVKIKLYLKVEESPEIAVLIFCEINDNLAGFCLV